MSKKVKIILLENVANIGRAGDIVMVSEGYARNMLIPQTKAALATSQNEHTLQQKNDARQKTSEAQLAALQSQAESLMSTELTLMARLKDGQEIFGQIKAAQIIKALNQQAHLKLSAKAIDLPAPIKTLGTFDVTVTLSPEVETVIKVTVVPDPKSQTLAAAAEE